MTKVPGKVVNGRIEVEGVELPEGAEVAVYHREDEDYDRTPEEEAELEESIAEIRRGEYVDGDEVMRRLRRRLGRE
jgi:Mg-chelatase subunit ChlI